MRSFNWVGRSLRVPPRLGPEDATNNEAAKGLVALPKPKQRRVRDSIGPLGITAATELAAAMSKLVFTLTFRLTISGTFGS